MAQPTVFTIKDTEAPPVGQLDLLPFHISYTGQAPINTYFIRKEIPTNSTSTSNGETNVFLVDGKLVEKTIVSRGSNTTAATAATATHSGTENGQQKENGTGDLVVDNEGNDASMDDGTRPTRYEASFRGRTVIGQEISLPPGYVGLVLNKYDPLSSTSSTVLPPTKPATRTRSAATNPNKTGGGTTNAGSTATAPAGGTGPNAAEANADDSTSHTMSRAIGARAKALKDKAAAKAKAKAKEKAAASRAAATKASKIAAAAGGPKRYAVSEEEDELADDDDDDMGPITSLQHFNLMQATSAPPSTSRSGGNVKDEQAVVAEEKAAPLKQEQDIKHDEDTEMKPVDTEPEVAAEIEAKPLHEEEQQVVKLELSSTFQSFMLWNADVAPDMGRDDYSRALSEWVGLAAEIHRV